MGRCSVLTCLAGAILCLIGICTTAQAGPHAGGTLIVHELQGAYTGDIDYCGIAPLSSCEEVDTRSEDIATGVAWAVYAAFPATTEPQLRGVQFGIDYSPGLVIDTYGSCGDFEDSLGSPWPDPGSGNAVIWLEPQTEHLVRVYWFTGYAYSLAGGLEFRVTPFPGQPDAYFADNSPAPVLDPAAALGALGFDVDGEAECPGPRTVLVRPDGSGDFATIQDAVRYCSAGSVVELEDGIYRGAGNVDVEFNHGLTVRSLSGDPRSCIIDCEGSPTQSHRAFLLSGSVGGPAVIEGIGFVNGYAGPDLDFNAEGGAIKAEFGADVIVRNCHFENCEARSAGAVDCADSKILLDGCRFVGNRTYESSGGAFAAGYFVDIVAIDCVFEDNTAALYGGAFAATGGSLLLERCEFRGNSAPRGGAIFLHLGTPVLRSCSVTENMASHGAGIYASQAALSVDDCTLADNEGSFGTAIYCDDAVGATSIQHSIVAGREDDLIRCGGAEFGVRTTCIWDQESGEWPTCLSELAGVWGNFSMDPAFCGLDGSEFHLRPKSPCAARSVPEWGALGAWPVGCAVSPGPELQIVAAGPSQNYELEAQPNPFRASTRITADLASPADLGRVSVAVFDASGRRVAVLAGSRPSDGRQTFDWDGRDSAGREVPAGLYFVRAASPEASKEIRVLRLR